LNKIHVIRNEDIEQVLIGVPRRSQTLENLCETKKQAYTHFSRSHHSKYPASIYHDKNKSNRSS